MVSVPRVTGCTKGAANTKSGCASFASALHLDRFWTFSPSKLRETVEALSKRTKGTMAKMTRCGSGTRNA